MTRALLLVALLLVGCRRGHQPPTATPDPLEPDAGVVDAAVDAAIDAPPPPPTWLRGSTHVHAAPSGDSTTDPVKVIAWYRAHGYDFLVLTDHNKVTVPATAAGDPIVLTGVELTYNPGACTEPAPEPGGRCRIHVNALGVTGRPDGRIEWADRKARDRRAMYQAALREAATLGGIAQLNHPTWHWGMTPELLAALAGDGAMLVEIYNAAFASWMDGDATHASAGQIWDGALTSGATLWGVASDDAHSYDPPGKYPAGGGWIMVDAARDGAAILDAIGHGRFYASTGVALTWASRVGDALRVELSPDETGAHTIDVIVDGEVVMTSHDRAIEVPIPATGYVRAVVTRDADGARAWVQPQRRERP